MKKTYDVKKESLVLHEKNRGKLGVVSLVEIKNKKDLSLAYTPGVAEACLKIHEDIKKAYLYTLKSRTIAVVSDGSAVLGLGNIGPTAALPVMEGKAILFKEFAGVDAFPICLDTQDTEEIIKTIKYIAPAFGGINLEDFSAPRCFEIEERLQKELDIPVMHDDQHGTAVVVLAGLINSLKIRKSKKEKVRVVINGAGAAGTAITKILADYGFKNIVVCDSRGIVSMSRSDINEEKKKLLKYVETKTGKKQNLTGDLSLALSGADIFIGVSKGNLLTKEMIKLMNRKPIIFALANPTPEIMPDIAKEAGALIVATGRSDFPNQINNVLAFPGIFKGALKNKIKQFNEKMFINAAEKLAGIVKKPTVENVLPNPFDKKIPDIIASAIK